MPAPPCISRMAFQRCFYLKNFRTISRYPGDAEPAALNITAGPPSLDGGQAKSSSSSGFKKDSNPSLSQHTFWMPCFVPPRSVINSRGLFACVLFRQRKASKIGTVEQDSILKRAGDQRPSTSTKTCDKFNTEFLTHLPLSQASWAARKPCFLPSRTELFSARAVL